MKKIPIDESILCDSLLSPIKDYEDAVIEVSSLRANIDCIISRNISDYKISRLPVFMPANRFGAKLAERSSAKLGRD
jgi:hypothetical protein